MKKINKKGFTLIELLIIITIMVILSSTAYVPYQHYQNKQKVRNSAKIISQTLYESRNLAINGTNNTSSGNLAIGVSFSGGNDYIDIYNYPYSEINDFSTHHTNYEDTKYHSKKIKLEKDIKLTNSDKYLLIYNAITGSGTYYKNTSRISSNIEINIGLKGTTSGNLTKKINYYTKTYITDID